MLPILLGFLSIGPGPAPAADKPAGFFVEAEDFDGLEEFEIWQTVAGRWYAKEHLYGETSALGGAYAVANEFSMGAVMEKKLDRVLPPGRYRVWLRMIAWMDSDDAIEVELNGAKLVYAWDINTRGRGYRWMPGEITTTQAGNLMRVKALKGNQQNFGETPRPPCKFLAIDTFYIGPADEKVRAVVSSRSSDDLVFGDVADPAAKPAPAAAAVRPETPPAGNLVANGSFEAGIGHGWTPFGFKAGILDAAFLDTEAVHGHYSLRSRHPVTGAAIPQLMSRLYRIKADSVYTLSAWFRGAKGFSLGLLTEDGKPVLSQPARGTGKWERVFVSGRVGPGDYYILISGEDFSVDAVQLEAAETASDFQPAVPVEVGFSQDMVGRVYFAGEPARARLLCALDRSSRLRSVTVDLTVHDIWDRVVRKDKLTLPVRPGETAERWVDLNPGRTGMFRAEAVVAGLPQAREETVFSVLPRPRTMGIDHDSWLGVMPEYNEYILASLQRAGYKWVQNIRVGNPTRWPYAEPEKGRIIWYDNLIGQPARYGLEEIFLLHMNYPSLPAWVKPSVANKLVPEDITLWQDFVRRTVEHYKDRVKYWQFSDDIHHYFSADEHYQCLKATYEAAKQADPGCTFIGWRFYLREVPGWEADLARTEPYSDIIYAADRVMREKYRKPAHSYLFFRGTTMYDYSTLGDPERRQALGELRRQVCLDVVRNFCEHAANVGYVDALFFYQAFLGGTQPWQTGMSKRAFEHDGALHLGAITPRIVEHFLYKADCLGRVNTGPEIRAYLFRKPGAAVAALWSNGGKEVRVGLDKKLKNLQVYDGMGNLLQPPVESGRLVITLLDTPVFLVAEGTPAEELGRLASGASLTLPIPIARRFTVREGRLAMELLVGNNTRQPISARVSLPEPMLFPLAGGAETEVTLAAIPPAGEGKAVFPLKYGLDRNGEFKRLMLDIQAGDYTFRETWLLWLLNSRPAAAGIKLTGDPAAWSGVLPVKLVTTDRSGATRRLTQVRSGAITGEEALTQGMAPILQGKSDLSGRVYSQWDAQNLYFAAEVLDNSVEKGDRVDIYLSNGGTPPSGPAGRIFDLSYRVDESGARAILKSGEESREVPAAFRKTAGGYFLELSVPWTALGLKPEAGRLLGFDASLTDSDQGVFHAQLVWSGAAYSAGDPAGFGVLAIGK